MKKLALLLLMLLPICLPVLGVDDEFFLKERDDQTVIKAFEKAKQHIDLFLNALEERSTENSRYEHYGVYLKFIEGEVVEYLWLGDVQKNENFYIGVIISEPRLLKETKNGKTIGFHASDIYDWQVTEKKTGKSLGAFLICATSDTEYLNSSSFACNL
ncbi:DUF2314 domain-containing protein [Pseudoalteromonas sp. KG3]|uniref:DUF2314 domain-containing protein n=2 Tax=Bacteria TaxID=2 RepID=A0ABR9FHB5_9GAMM|nr:MULTISPECIES: DUF2314 domain-containing protein [Pseudoalteromonas]MBE0456211.1 DUF2314 domain-containing protein [Pseudoalteromonas prydzensis]WKD24247.1 DUF2314 domain-containing protein [Pseudoalteromonas sp. KG3]